MNELAKKENSNIQAVNSEASQYQKMIELALNNNADIDKLERLMDLQERWEQKQAKSEYVKAMANFQRNCPTIKKSKEGYNFKYAPMEDVVSQVGSLLADNGLSYRFEQDQANGLIGITCVTSHVSGHSERLRIESEADSGPQRNKIQAIGSAITYLKRYSFLGSFGIATADEDLDGRMIKVNGNFLNDSQISQVEELIGVVGANREKFLTLFKSKSVEDIPATSFNKAILMLKAKGAK